MGADGPTHFKIPIRAREEFGAPWLLNHRVDLHAELRRLATREDDLTAPAVVRTASRVERIVRFDLPSPAACTDDWLTLLAPVRIPTRVHSTSQRARRSLRT